MANSKKMGNYHTDFMELTNPTHVWAGILFPFKYGHIHNHDLAPFKF